MASVLLIFNIYVSKEMSERIIGKFKTSKYGRLSIITSYFLDVITKFDVSPNSFLT